MSCIVCGGKTFTGLTTDVTDLGSCLIIIRNVPCYKCTECNEIIYTADVVKRLEDVTIKAKQAMSGVAIMEFADNVA